MKITNIKSIYFSGTGTTEQAVSRVSKTLGEALEVPVKSICINKPSVREEPQVLSSTELLVIGCPTYAGRLPNLLLPYFQKQIKGENTLAVAICLYGNRNVDDALMELCLTIEENGCKPIGAAAVIGQHVFAPALGTNRPDKKDFRALDNLSKAVIGKLQQEEAPPSVTVVGNNPVQPYYSPRDRYGYPINILKVRPKTYKKKCNKCGICIKACPVSAISPDPTVVVGPCMKCGACLKRCPQQAKYYDDSGFLFHKEELEATYQEAKKTQIFY